ncbi:hypothetical protein ACPYO6_16380 [Georgenia sp. Z1344]|uniref:hypothetical protein n=1 Tax=Georgenia sp. Z1344 TaxID=3416706 RepID=UPI003CF04350
MPRGSTSTRAACVTRGWRRRTASSSPADAAAAGRRPPIRATVPGHRSGKPPPGARVDAADLVESSLRRANLWNEVEDGRDRPGRLVEYDTTETIFQNPANQQTVDYVTGRFG